MTYTHLTTDELVLIESYFNTPQPVGQVAKRLNWTRQTIYNIYHFLADGHNVLEYYQQYKDHKSHCGRNPIVLPDAQKEYVQNKVKQGWAPDILVGREGGRLPVLLEHFIGCSKRAFLTARIFQ